MQNFEFYTRLSKEHDGRMVYLFVYTHSEYTFSRLSKEYDEVFEYKDELYMLTGRMPESILGGYVNIEHGNVTSYKYRYVLPARRVTLRDL